MANVAVTGQRRQMLLTLPKLRATVSWRSIFSLTPLFVSLDAHGIDLDVRRDRDGRLSMLGQSFDLDSRQARSDDESGKFVDWLVGQRRIALSDATIRWTDEPRNSQALVLRGVTLNILKQGMEQSGRTWGREREGQ